MSGLPENTSYTPNTNFDYGSIINTISKIGRSLRQRFSPKPSSQYQSAPNAVQSNSPVNVPESVKKLGTITTPYGSSTKYEAVHPGVDIGGKYNSPISAFEGGKVTDVVSGKKRGDAGFGNYVVVVDNQNNKWRYSHLLQNYVRVGDILGKGQVLGTMGNTGQSYSASGRTDREAGTHLDLRIVDAANKYYINPLNYIRG